MTKAVIWDMDGVLVNTAPFHFRAWRRILKEEGKNLAEKEFLATFGMKSEDILRKTLSELGTEELRLLARRKEEYYRQEVEGKVEPLPGVRAMLESLRPAGFRQALASSAPVTNIRLILDSLGISNYFEAIVSGDEVKAGKPAPEIFLEASRRLGVPPGRCVVVEDSIAGVKAARAAGMHCVAVINSNPPEKLGEADMVLKSLEEVSPLALEKLLG